MTIIDNTIANEEIIQDLSLRPRNFHDYVGQNKVKDNLYILIEAARRRKEPIEHVLFYGNSGLGKTTLAYVIANETQSKLKITSGPAIEKIGDLASLLTNLSQGDILFIDECHRLNKTVEELLYPAMEEYALDIVIGKGPSARVLRLDIPKFTLIGATTRVGLLSSPFRNRFGATFRLDYYNQKDIEKIINRSAQILNIKIDQPSLTLIARASRFTPRVANRILRRVRDYAEVKFNGHLNEQSAKEALQVLEIDDLGLEPSDRRLLKILIEKFAGGPVGLGTLATAAGEETDTIEDYYEPYLIQLGLLSRTPKGRVATKLAYQHLGIDYPESQGSLL